MNRLHACIKNHDDSGPFTVRVGAAHLREVNMSEDDTDDTFPYNDRQISVCVSDACECTLSVASVSQYESCACILCPSVVDVYQRWCGPCRAVVSLFRKIKNELGDDLLHFATVR